LTHALDGLGCHVVHDMGAAQKGLKVLAIEWDDGPHAKLNTAQIRRRRPLCLRRPEFLSPA